MPLRRECSRFSRFPKMLPVTMFACIHVVAWILLRRFALFHDDCRYLRFATMPMRKADRAALVSLFQLLGGPHWLNNDGWDVDGTSDPCDHQTHWRGVGCIDPCDDWRDGPNCYFGRVTALNLRDNNLTGSMTNWTGIGDLHNLTWLDLSFNSISGSVPAEIGEIQNIVIIHLGAPISLDC